MKSRAPLSVRAAANRVGAGQEVRRPPAPQPALPKSAQGQRNIQAAVQTATARLAGPAAATTHRPEPTSPPARPVTATRRSAFAQVADPYERMSRAQKRT